MLTGQPREGAGSSSKKHDSRDSTRARVSGARMMVNKLHQTIALDPGDSDGGKDTGRSSAQHPDGMEWTEQAHTANGLNNPVHQTTKLWPLDSLRSIDQHLLRSSAAPLGCR